MTAGIDDVLDVVAGHFDVNASDIRSLRRTRNLLPARHVAAYLGQKISGLSMQEIGNRLGGRDHTIIVMYCRTIARRADEDEAFERLLHQLEDAIRSRAEQS